MVRRMLTASSPTSVPVTDAIAGFLFDMKTAAQETFPLWRERLAAGLDDAFAGDADAVSQFLGAKPIEDLYFAGIVGMEAARIRRYFPPDAASPLLSELAAQIDSAAERTDRAVSDFAYFVLGRIDLETGVERMRMPYDLVISMLLDRLGFSDDIKTKALMLDIVFRHNLGEPLARGVPAWWKAFAARFTVTVHRDDTPVNASRRA